MSTFSRLVSVVGQLLGTLAEAIAHVVHRTGAPVVVERIGFAREGVLLDGGCSDAEAACYTEGTGCLAGQARRLTIALAAAVVGWLALVSTPARAASIFTYQSQLTGFTAARQVAFDPSGDIYVADQAAHAVDEYDPSGATLLHQQSIGSGAGTPFGVAVDDTTGNIYVADAADETVDVFDASWNLLWQLTGTPNGAFAGLRQLAVDQATGDLYVTEYNANVVDVFSRSTASAAGSYLRQLTGTPNGSFLHPGSVAVDPVSGDVYVAELSGDRVDRFTSTGVYVSQLTGTPAGAFASTWGVGTDASGDVFVADKTGAVVDEFSNAGTYLDQLTGTPSASFLGPIAASVGPTGDLYVVDGGTSAHVVDIFAVENLPDVTTGQASSLSPTGATLNGTVNPDGTTITDCHFDYVNDAGYSPSAANPYSAGGTSPCSSTPSGSSPVSVSADLTGLTGGTGYHFRLVASNPSGTSYGSDEVFGPPAVDGQSSANVTQTTATVRAQVNPDGVDSSCRFEYVDAAGYDPSAADPYGAGQTVACSPADLGAGSGDVSASANLSGLTAGTTYHWRVVATNASGSADGTDQTLSTGPALTIDSASASNITASSATLNAQINPQGTDTSYHFEYGTTKQYGTSVPVPDADIGSGTGDVAVSQQITGLSANTEYHWRVVATNSLAPQGIDSADHTFIYPIASSGPDTCPNAAFRQGPSAGLPDCRAYEMVTPPYTEGYIVYGTAVSADGSWFIGNSIGTFAGSGASTFVGAQYEFVRAGSGWTTTPLSPPASQFPLAVYQDATADGSTALFTTGTVGDGLFTRQTDGTIAAIGPAQPPATPRFAGAGVLYRGASSDFSDVLFTLSGSAAGDFWPFDSTTGSDATSLYEYVGTGNSQPFLVGVSGGAGSTSLISDCGTHLGAINSDAYNAVSATGATVFFTAVGADRTNCGATQPPADELFARVDQSKTVAISEPSSADCSACDTSAPQDATFQGASQDGSKVFFLTAQPLLGGDSTENLYEYDFDAPAGQRLTRVSAGDPSGANVEGVMRVSEDGSHVYFVAKGVLTSAPNSQGQVAQSGANNMYVYEPDPANPGQFKTAFIAALSGGDQADWAASDGRPVQATPDGDFLLFASVANLTGDAPDQTDQIYLYDAQTGALVRVSIGEDGFNDNGTTGNAGENSVGASGVQSVSGEGLDISNDGSYVFFTSPDGLTAGALNNAPITQSGNLANNVYEYHNGNVYLISDGRDTGSNNGSSTVQFLGTDASGADAFFTTGDQLVPADTGSQEAIYDARIDGGFPASSSPPACQGDACQGTPSSAPPVPTAGSVSFSGPGNLSPGAGTAKVTVLSKVVHGTSFLLRVRVPGRGRITITGKGIKTVLKSVSKAGTYRLRVTLTAKTKRVLTRKRKLRLRLRVADAPASGSASAVSVSVTVAPGVQRGIRTSTARRATSHSIGGAR